MYTALAGGNAFALNRVSQSNTNCNMYKAAGNADKYVNFEPINASQNTYRVKEARYGGYMTDNGTNVSWDSGGTKLNNRQVWVFEPVSGGGSSGGGTVTPPPTSDNEVRVTGMPSNGGHTNQPSDTEFFHPSAGMASGTWKDNDDRLGITSKVKAFYKKVYGVEPTSADDYLYCLYGSKYNGTVKPVEYIGKFHPGVDIKLRAEAPIRSAHAGKIVSIQRVGGPKAATNVTIQAGGYDYCYVHLEVDSSLYDKKDIAVGDVLGTQANYGLGFPESDTSSHSHLHIEVHKSTSNPGPAVPIALSESFDRTIVPYAHL
ncbi:M23 family metallopeptidase [Ruminococcaceae bacterium OttesenSCG-928-N02]|nr:M23 family metallopeptidase [Ruminococcaceae bacterium OttesenSCG-928-N02]